MVIFQDANGSLYHVDDEKVAAYESNPNFKKVESEAPKKAPVKKTTKK